MNKKMKRVYQKPQIRAVALCLNKFVAVSGGSNENTDWQFGSKPMGEGDDPERGPSRYIWGSVWDEE